MWCAGGDPTYEMPSIGGGRRSLPETARHERFQVVSHVQESRNPPPRGQTVWGVRDPRTKHEPSFAKPFTMLGEANRSFTRLSMINRPCSARSPIGTPASVTTTGVCHRTRGFFKNRPDQVLSLSQMGKGIWSNPWDFTSNDLRWQRKLAHGPGPGERTAVTGFWVLCASISGHTTLQVQPLDCPPASVSEDRWFGGGRFALGENGRPG